jgi:hypothetical protein
MFMLFSFVLEFDYDKVPFADFSCCVESVKLVSLVPFPEECLSILCRFYLSFKCCIN